jgi:hypothetical protein
MKGRGGGKRRAAWLRFSCFSRPVGDSSDSAERWEAGSKVSNIKVGAKKAILKGEQGPPSLDRDSQSRLEAYLGRGQQGLHGASDSVLAQAAHTAATERRLKGLLDDEIACNSNAALSTSHFDSVGLPSVAALDSGAASSFEGSSPIKAAPVESRGPQSLHQSDSMALQRGSKGGGAALIVSGSSSEPQLHAAPATPSKLLNRVSMTANSPPDDSETLKTSLAHDATPTASDSGLSHDSILQLADRPTSASIVAPGYSQTQLLTTPFASIFPHSTHALHPSRSSHSLASAADSMFTEGSVKLDAIAPAPSHHTTIRTIPITLSSSTLALSVDGYTASLTSSMHPSPSLPHQQQQGKHQRAKTMPHLHSNSQEFLLIECDKSSSGDALSIRSTHSRRHTAIVLLSNSEDENEDQEEEEEEKEASEGAAASATTSAPSVASSVMSSRGSRTIRRRLSDVYEGHHIPLQKLRQQMGNPEGKHVEETIKKLTLKYFQRLSFS